MNLFKIETGIKDQRSEVRGQGSVVNYEAGFTLTEVLFIMAIMSILLGIGYSTLRTPNEQIACKEIYSKLQLGKMQAVSTGVRFPVDVNDDLTKVDNVDVPGEVDYLTTQPASLPWGTWPANGVDFDGAGGTTVYFSSKGMAVDVSGVSTSGSVYLKDVKNPNKLCAVSVLTTGIVRMSTSSNGGTGWN